MNDNMIESIEWHKEQLTKLLSDEDDFGKVESEIDEIIEKFRLKGSKDKSKRKTKNIKDIISSAFGSKKKDEESKSGFTMGGGYTPVSDVTKPPTNIDTQLRALKGSQKRHRR